MILRGGEWNDGILEYWNIGMRMADRSDTVQISVSN
jgi:hypothetical protein